MSYKESIVTRSGGGDSDTGVASARERGRDAASDADEPCEPSADPLSASTITKSSGTAHVSDDSAVNRPTYPLIYICLFRYTIEFMIFYCKLMVVITLIIITFFADAYSLYPYYYRCRLCTDFNFILRY